MLERQVALCYIRQTRIILGNFIKASGKEKRGGKLWIYQKTQ